MCVWRRHRRKANYTCIAHVHLNLSISARTIASLSGLHLAVQARTYSHPHWLFFSFVFFFILFFLVYSAMPVSQLQCEWACEKKGNGGEGEVGYNDIRYLPTQNYSMWWYKSRSAMQQQVRFWQLWWKEQSVQIHLELATRATGLHRKCGEKKS